MPFDHLARSILSNGDTVRRNDRVNWLDDTVNWVATAGKSKVTSYILHNIHYAKFKKASCRVSG